jgi:hypothetical protein
VERRVAQGRPPDSPANRVPEPDADTSRRWVGLGGALGFGLLALFAYSVGDEATRRLYNHFVWQALAFLDGRAAIDYPVARTAGHAGNAFFQDVMPVAGPGGEPTGFGLVPFPPLPAVMLLPFVAVWGIDTDHQAITGLFGAVDVMLAWWMLGRLPIGTAARAVGTAFLGFGTVFFYAAELGTTWYFAHIVAVGFALLAIGTSLAGDPAAATNDRRAGQTPNDHETRTDLATPRRWINRRQVLAGLLFGLACTARLSVVAAAPLLMLVGPGRGWRGRSLSAAIGAALPIGALLVYNLATTGQVVSPAYDFLYQAEARYYPTLGYNLDWGIEDPRYIPANARIALLSTPDLFPTTTPDALGFGLPVCTRRDSMRGLFDKTCPIAVPRDTGMSILLTSPAYLLAIPGLVSLGAHSRLAVGASIAVLLVLLFNLMHFSQGWVQFGYRFSNDFVPFALPLVALGAQRLRRVPLVAGGLLAVSIAVNLWGAVWGMLLGW